MANSKNRSNEKPAEPPASPSLANLLEQSQGDFELEFFAAILEKAPTFADVLRVHGNNLTLKGRYEEGMAIDKRLVQLRPNDYLAFYNLACSYALLKQTELALKTLRRAVELGYRDFRYMKQDRDLESIRRDPRFRQLLREFESK
jgi:tetratricopeptide (TPR) repeat protein